MVSIIVPVYNSDDLIAPCHAVLAPVADTLAGGTEIIYVDDGSRDGTLDALRAVQAQDSRVRIIELAANFGQHAAIFAGIEHARGHRLVTIDVDLQCDPRDIPRVLAPLEQGYDLVSGIRVGRQGPLGRRFFSRLMNGLARRLAGVPVNDVGCSLNAMTRELASMIAQCGELRRFAKPVALQLARQVAEVEVRHARSPQGRASSYSRTALVRLFMDFLVSVLGDASAWAFVVASCLALLLALAALAAALVTITTSLWPALPVVCGGLSIIAGLTALLALVCAYLQRIHRQTSGVPMYLVRRLHESGPMDRRDAHSEP